MNHFSVRPMKEEDISLIMNYWRKCSDEDFLRMGLDKSKFIISAAFEENLKNILHSSPDETNIYFLMWELNGKTVGYSPLRNLKRNEIGDIHLQMFDASLRGKGYGAILFCLSVVKFYELFNLKMILCEPRSSNPMPNRLLEKIGFDKWKTYISTPAEVALTCELNSYIINGDKANLFLDKAGINNP